nr:MAG TPA: hypothetical protein [Caudoviricetes sp.]
MALQKEIELENGVILNYHRITNLSKITNISNLIEVSSYISEAQRKKEKAYQDLQKKSANHEPLSTEEQMKLEKGMNVLVNSDYITLNYDEEMTIEDAYNYLKRTEKFKNAELI